MLDALTSVLMYVVPFLLVLTVIVTIHELGHFWVARAFGVKVDRFAIGFGKAIFSRTDKHGIEWRVGWMPLGGYVKFSGDMDASSVPDSRGLDALKADIQSREGAGAERDYFHFKPVWQRMLIVAAGPFANFVLALALFTVLFSIIGEQFVAARVLSVTPGSPAALAGFQRGDLITAIDGRQVRDGEQVTRAVVLSANTPLTFTVERGETDRRITVTPLRQLVDDEIAGRVRKAQIGLDLGPLVRSDVSYRRVNPVEAVQMGAARIVDVLGTTLKYLGRIFTGKESGDLLNGPVGIAKAAGGVTQQASEAAESPGGKAALVALNLVQLAAILSIGIGFLNLLPIPVLDGGHLVFYAYEAVARKPVAAAVQEAGYRVGLALLAGLMLFATWNDLQKLNLFNILGGLVS
jgi:regulator of sigma E protease